MNMPSGNPVKTSSSCGCTPSTDKRLVKWTTAGGIFAALGICAACCLLPTILVGVGIAGAWVGTLDSLAPYKWIFVGLTVVLIGYGFYDVYWKAKSRCAVGPSCETCGAGRFVRMGLWAGTLLALGGIIYEHLEPLLAP